MRKLIKISILVLVVFLTFQETVNANPQSRLEKAVDEVIDILYNPDVKLDTRQDRVLQALQGQFSFDAISRRALGRAWNRFEPGQQSRFVDLFTELLLQSYTSGLEGDALSKRPSVSWEGQRELRPGLLQVDSTVAFNDMTFPANYRMVNLEGEWVVYDMIVEGVSLVGNYRQQFNSMMQRGSPEDLLTSLEKRVLENAQERRNRE